MDKNIELELRAEITPNQLEELTADLNKKSKLIYHIRRLSVMFLGGIGQSKFDIRVRINSDGKGELIAKKGDHHSHDRVEASQEISKGQFMGIVKILAMFGFQSKVTERENFVFDLGNDIKMSLVKAKSIAYVEIEKMSHKKNMEENKKELLNIANDFNLKIIDSAEEFDGLCDRLTNFSDWEFDGSLTHVEKLAETLKDY